MRNQSKAFIRLLAAGIIVVSAAVFTSAQTNPTPSRITQAIDPAIVTVLRGNTHPLAQAQFDRGPAPASLPMQRMLLVLKRSAAQETALDALLEQQQDASSPNFHQWLTPQEFGQQFGPSDQDIQTITSWLQSQGFQIDRVLNGRTVIEFSGTAGEVQSAFHTAIHQYAVNGENHWANSSDPAIPTALAPVVAGIDTLYNFPRTPMIRIAGAVSRARGTGNLLPVEPLFTLGGQCGLPGLSCYGVGPYDFATIYDVSPLWNASPAVDGTGETVAIVGESDISIQDVRDFRNYFGLPANDPQIIVDGADPGTVPGDETESDLDVEWAGAVAKGATIDFVTSATTESSLGVDLSAEYVIDNNLAGVLSDSYGICELGLGTTGNQFYSQLWQQAAAQGITVLVAAGDSGSAGCDDFTAPRPAPAQYGLMVSGFASTPYNVALGGTDFNDLTDASTYWSSTNAPPPGQSSLPATVSALSYIPETTWNDSCTNAVFGNLLGFSSNAETNCNNPQLQNFVIPEGGAGGKSSCTSSDGQTPSSCSGGYSKPAWQTALTPSDGNRDVPDVSLFAAVGSPSGAFYLLCAADMIEAPYTSCQATDPNTQFVAIGGTSAAAPTFAGMIAMVEQKTGSRQGDANYILYKLAAQSGASCNSSNGSGPNCVFHDVTNGTNAMPCASGSPNCTTTAPGHAYGVLSGYAAGTGYDQATGLGSVDAKNLVSAWSSLTLSLEGSSTTLTLTPPSGGSLSNLTHGQTVTFSAGVSAVAPATGTPTGTVSLVANTGTDGQSVQSVTLNSSGNGSGSTNALPGGTYAVVAQYPGDGTFKSSVSAGTAVTVNPEASKVQLAYELLSPTTGAVTNPNASTAVFGTPSLLRVNVTSAAGDACPNNGPGSNGCPTGSVVLSDNGNSLGTFALNSLGYAEDLAIDLVGGTHSIGASYPGDSSYNPPNPNPTAQTFTVTPAATTTSVSVPNGGVVGSTVNLYANISAENIYSQHAPSGTVTFFSGATELASAPVSGSTVSGHQASAFASASTTSLAHGTSSITAQYSGDASYATSTSSAATVNILYPTSMSLSASPNNIIYGQGTSVTLTAIVSTGEPASNAALKPTGGISFLGINGTETITAGQDASGNWVLQATIALVPQQTQTVFATYSGDSNYGGSSQSTSIAVTVPDFSLSANSTALVITAGETGSTTVTVTPLTNYASAVQLSCYATQVAGAPCVFSQSSVTLSNGQAATATLSLSVPAPSSSMSSSARRIHLSGLPLIGGDRDGLMLVSTCSVFACLILILAPRRFQWWRAATALLSVGMLALAIGCGNKTSVSSTDTGGNGEGSQGSPVATTTSLSTTSTKITPSAGATLTATVSSPRPVTGQVSFLDASFPGVIAPYVALTSNAAQAQMTDSGSVSVDPGTHVISAQYMGDANNQPSQSGGVSIVVTGSTQQLVCGATSTDQHCFELNVTVQ